jgi:hypothetical protein
MERQLNNNLSDKFYIHVNTLAGAFNFFDDELLTELFEKDYLDQIKYSERNFDGKIRNLSPLEYRQDLEDLVLDINRRLGTPEFGNGITVRVSWMHGSKDLPTPEEIDRAGGYLIVKCFVQSYFFNRAREREMRVGPYMDMRINQILELMENMGGERVWWFIGDEPFSSYHWHGYLVRERQRGGLEPFRSRKEALESYRKFVLGHQMGSEMQRAFYESGEYKTELEEAGEMSFYPLAKRMNLNLKKLNIASGSTSPMDAHYQFELNFSKMFILERVFLGGIQIGVAFVRGAAKQYGRYWGMYQEIWDGKNFGTRSYTRFDRNLKRVTGFTPDLLLRARLAAFFSGVHVNFMKGANQTHFAPGDGKTLQETRVAGDHRRLADFCLRKHPIRGETHTPVALLLEYRHGWTPVWAEEDKVWGAMPFEEGDYMISNFFDEAFPRRTAAWNQLPLPAGHPFGRRFFSLSLKHRTEEYSRRLRGGYDHRPHEHRCLTSSRWGDSFDVVLENCSLEVLRQYPVVLMLGRIKFERDLAVKLREYVMEGGYLLVNVRQLGADADNFYDFLGIKLTGERSTGTESHCRICGTRFEEPLYCYSRVELSPAAEVMAVNEHGDVLIAEHPFGKGRIIVTTPHYLQAYDGDEKLEEGQRRFTVFLEIAKDMITHLTDRFSPVKVEGAPVEYIVNSAGEDIVVTLINNEVTEWQGSVTTGKLDEPSEWNVRDWWEDKPVPSEVKNSVLNAAVCIPPWSFKVMAICRKPRKRSAI